MSSFRKFLKALFILSWIFLFLWSFRGVRLWLHEAVLWTRGFNLAPSGQAPPEFVPLHRFHPVSRLRPYETETIPARPRFPTIEIHGHIFRKVPPDFTGAMDRSHVRYFINLSGWTKTAAQYRKLIAKHPSPRILHFVGFHWKHAGKSENFGRLIAKDLEEVARLGARGVKLWKNFGLKVKDPQGKLIALDDRRLDPVWDVCAKYRLVVSMHSADPPAFFTPTDRKNERFGELGRKPQWSFYRPGLPSFKELMEQRDRLFKRRRDVTFIAVHFGEYAHDLKKAEKLLKDHPNVILDTAQRIDELGRQPRAARKFILRHQDKILFGTDGPPDFKKSRIYWRFFETRDEYFDYYPPHKPRKGLWKIHGLGLPDATLKKLYYDNAARLLRLPR